MKQQEFDEYIRQVEPFAQESANAWKTAIGLQQVDGLKPSSYLLETARKNIEGDITIDEVRQLLDSYYKSKTIKTAEEHNEEEADKVSANIKKILSSRTLAFNTNGFISIHRRIFDGVFSHAGEIRNYNISKKEWVLRGNSVDYLNWEDLRRALDFDIQQERDFDYKGLTEEQKIKHICHFVSGLWQIHPFCEGNTRTTAVFTIQYLRSIGYNVDNEIFALHSWYFRNALVRANYKNSKLGINYDSSFLEKFFQNLLLGTNYELKNGPQQRDRGHLLPARHHVHRISLLLRREAVARLLRGLLPDHAAEDSGAGLRRPHQPFPRVRQMVSEHGAVPAIHIRDQGAQPQRERPRPLHDPYGPPARHNTPGVTAHHRRLPRGLAAVSQHPAHQVADEGRKGLTGHSHESPLHHPQASFHQLNQHMASNDS